LIGRFLPSLTLSSRSSRCLTRLRACVFLRGLVDHLAGYLTQGTEVSGSRSKFYWDCESPGPGHVPMSILTKSARTMALFGHPFARYSMRTASRVSCRKHESQPTANRDLRRHPSCSSCWSAVAHRDEDFWSTDTCKPDVLAGRRREHQTAISLLIWNALTCASHSLGNLGSPAIARRIDVLCLLRRTISFLTRPSAPPGTRPKNYPRKYDPTVCRSLCPSVCSILLFTKKSNRGLDVWTLKPLSR
jgi:hypothetical protein